MSRKRYITTDMSSNDKVVALAQTNVVAALMFPWLCVHCDDWARMEASVSKIKRTVFPEWMFPQPQVEEGLHDLSEARLIHMYEVAGHQYLMVDPMSFYDLNTYIQKARQTVDGSRHPTPPDHPWGHFWKSRYPLNGKPDQLQPVATSSNELQTGDISRQNATESSNQLQPDDDSSTELQHVARGNTVPSHAHAHAPSEEEEEARALSSNLGAETDPTLADVVRFVEGNRPHWSRTPYLMEQARDAVNEFGGPIVLLALKQAVAGQADSWTYVDRILAGWKDNGVHTVDDARAEIARHEVRHRRRDGRPQREFARGADALREPGGAPDQSQLPWMKYVPPELLPGTPAYDNAVREAYNRYETECVRSLPP